jgi:hypothetical protein
LGAEVLIFESGSALKRIEESCFGESSLKAICIPGQVDFIPESALAANVLEFVGVCEANARFTICEHTLVNERGAGQFNISEDATESV